MAGWVSKISELFVSETLGASIGLESTKLVTHFNVHIPISSFIHQIIFSTKSSIHSSFIFWNPTHFIKISGKFITEKVKKKELLKLLTKYTSFFFCTNF
jgi:hypothetical protein